MAEALEGVVLSAMSKASLSLVDGWGATRVVTNMRADTDVRFVVRPLEPGDERLTLDWANDPDVRRNSFSVYRIDEVTHHLWFSKRIANSENCKFYVVETTAGLPVGPVRFECLSPGVWEIHYSMDRCLRGRGTGTAFLKAALDHFCASVASAMMVIACVKSSNPASQHIFKKLGFSQSLDGRDFHFQLNLLR
jgi:RimJ/RimL family protein N-acetyltransferase